jgi:hypothetical protein
VTTFSASLTNRTALLPKSHNCSYHVHRPILAPQPHLVQKRPDLRAHDSRIFSTYDLILGCITLPAPEIGDFLELLLLYRYHYDIWICYRCAAEDSILIGYHGLSSNK